MTPHAPPHRIAILGFGAIGRQVLERLRADLRPAADYAVLTRTAPAAHDPGMQGVRHLRDLGALLDWAPTLVVECAGHAVFAAAVPALLRAGADVVVASIGALSDAAVRERIEAAAAAGGSRCLTVSGAIGGLDALEAARGAGLDAVDYTGRKPPAAWKGTPAEALADLAALAEPALLFDGNALDAARLYPKNANVTAAVALAGVGFERTRVRLLADPGIAQNVHELRVAGAFGRFTIVLENHPFPGNPKTSWLAALSIDAELRRYFGLRPPAGAR
jgi:aspartate dehydrogenase